MSGDSDANTLRGGAGNDILDGGGGRGDILEGGTGQDDYIFDTSDDRIRSDSDGGRLLFRAADASTGVEVDRISGYVGSGDVTISLGFTDITIADGGADDAYQHGSYSIHYGASDTFFANLYVGRDNAADTLTGSSETDLLTGLGGNDLLDGGRGDDRLDGGKGADTYRFDAGDGTDTISSKGQVGRLIKPIDGAGNELVFRAPSGVSYSNSNFDFDKGNWNGQSFSQAFRGYDLQITVSSGGTTRNTVIIEDYFDQADNAYTIYRTGYNSGSDGTIVSTAPAETS